MTSHPQPFSGAHLEWPVERAARTFVVRVVEPDHYAPDKHADIFASVVSHLISPGRQEIGRFETVTSLRNPDPFDLVTFPEAFLPPEALIEALSAIAQAGPTGCIHVGLRPGTADRHLFSTDEVKALVEQIEATGDRVTADIASFRHWLYQQPDHRHFNVGCIFAVDAEGQLRVCLHPKCVRAEVETSPLPEHHMDEGNLLTVVTLHPTNKQYLTVTLQPIICSDALSLTRDRPGGSPLGAVNSYVSCLSDRPPDHIDVVSVATCTKQPEVRRDGRPTFREWHHKFRDTFKDAAQAGTFARHHYAAIVLSNFRNLGPRTPGGLSGIFLPVPPRYPQFHPKVVVSCFGRPGKDDPDNRWSRPEDNSLESWNNRGFIACLDPFAEPAGTAVRIFSFTIQRLPRDNSLWTSPESLTHCGVTVAETSPTSGLLFTKESGHA